MVVLLEVLRGWVGGGLRRGYCLGDRCAGRRSQIVDVGVVGVYRVLGAKKKWGKGARGRVLNHERRQ
jgi:hypothetical protein